MRVNNSRIIKNNAFEIVFFTTILFGVFVGTVCYINDILMFSDKTYDFAFEITKDNYINLFMQKIIVNSTFIILLFLCGFSAVLQPLIFFSGFVKGLGLGRIICLIYSVYGINGVMKNAFQVVFASGIVMFTFVISAKEAFYHSFHIADAVFSEKNFIGFKEASRNYILRFLVFELISTVGVAFECLVNFI